MVKSLVLNEHGFTEGAVDDLEVMIDRYGIEALLQQISEICEAKAEHTAHMWQDTALAQRWMTVRVALRVASTKAAGL